MTREAQYALIALRYIHKQTQEGRRATSKEIAERFSLPPENTAKVLQRLKALGWLSATKGTSGGYTCERDLRTISVAEFLRGTEGPESLQVCCLADHIESTGGSDCACEIQNLLNGMNEKVLELLESMNLVDVTGNPVLHQIDRELPLIGNGLPGSGKETA